MEIKYRVGQKVKIKPNLVIGIYYDGCLFTREMGELRGKVVTINSKNIFFENRYAIIGHKRNWTKEMFCPATKTLGRLYKIREKILNQIK